MQQLLILPARISEGGYDETLDRLPFCQSVQPANVFVCNVELMKFLKECDFHCLSELKCDMLSLFRSLELNCGSLS